MARRILALLAAAGLLNACGSKDPGPGPTPIIDPPAVVCPADVSITGITGSSQAVTFPIPVPTKGTQPVTVTCSPNSGSAFPLGTTAVRCTASDAEARQASCNFNVTVKGLTIGVTKYLAFGDSVTEGQNGLPLRLWLEFIDPLNSYPTKLQALLDGAFPAQGVTVVNRGRGGEHAQEARIRLPEELAQHRPGAMTLIDGYNNLLAACKTRDVSFVTLQCAAEIETSVGALREMVRIARNAGVAHVFVGTVTPSGPHIPPVNDRRLLPAAVDLLNAKIRSQIPGEGGTVVDLYARFLGHEAEYNGPDGLHILPAGNQAIAEAFFAAIKTAIPQTPAFGLTR
jgi:lysophospholipase L1-like esterase